MTDLTQIVNHHIVPDYICKELGLTTSYKVKCGENKRLVEFYFKENHVLVTRKLHAEIHWGYFCNDLSLLLEVCSPPQWVLDMIPLGDSRDNGAAQLIALGEVEGIDTSGKNNGNYKHGRSIGGAYDPIYNKKYYNKNREKLIIHKREYNNRPETKARMSVWGKEYYNKNKENILANKKEYYYKNRENILADKKEYYEKNKEEITAHKRKLYDPVKRKEMYDPVKRKEMYERKKLERATATLDNFM
tara:strand:- start:27 stop:764 length:738 start_codon:yes stop_codon:yes gene_type:complete